MVCLTAIAAVVTTDGVAEAAVWSSSDKWGTWSDGGHTLRNDVWGSGAGPQTIWANSYGNFGVWADHPDTGEVKAYPHSAKNVNRSLSALSRVSSSFDVSVPGSGAYTAAYDIWANNNAYETMLWMNTQRAVGPIGSRQTTATVGGHTWDVNKAVQNWIKASGWFGDVTLGEVQFGYEITSSAGGLNFDTNSYSVSSS